MAVLNWNTARFKSMSKLLFHYIILPLKNKRKKKDLLFRNLVNKNQLFVFETVLGMFWNKEYI